MANVQYYGTGRRKHSVARVRLVAGEGNIKVNGRELRNTNKRRKAASCDNWKRKQVRCNRNS